MIAAKKVSALTAMLLATLIHSSAYAESPYEWSAALTLESITNLDGGIKTGTSQLANLDLGMTLDTDAAGWWSGGEWFVYLLGDTGNNPADYLGDLQGVSNIAADEALKVYEFWYQHSFANERIKLLFGLHDYNSTFYTLEAASLFTHASFGIGPETAQVVPSIFPTTATALHLTWQGDHQYVLAAVYDGIPGDPNNPRDTQIEFNAGDGVFSAVEWGWSNQQQDKIALGVWQHTAEVENPVNGAISDQNSGVYVIAEKGLNDTAAVFVQLGQADDEFNQLEHYAGAGIRLNRMWLDGDSLGLAVAHARHGDPYLKANSMRERAETAWELTYFTPVIPHLNVQASVYYIQNPSMESALDNALALGVRAYIEF